MAEVVTTYKEGNREYLEICPLEECKHPVGPRLHWIYEFPAEQSRETFIADALKAAAAKER